MVKPIREPEWNDKIKAGNLWMRLYKHAMGEIKMSSTEIRAAQICIAKIIPDKRAVEVSGEVKTNYVMGLPLPEGMTSDQWQKAYQVIQ